MTTIIAGFFEEQRKAAKEKIKVLFESGEMAYLAEQAAIEGDAEKYAEKIAYILFGPDTLIG